MHESPSSNVYLPRDDNKPRRSPPPLVSMDGSRRDSLVGLQRLVYSSQIFTHSRTSHEDTRPVANIGDNVVDVKPGIFPSSRWLFNFWAVVKSIYFAAKAPKSKIMHRKHEWKLNSSNLRKKRWYFRTCETISLTRYVLRQKQNKTETLSMCMN